MADVLQRVVKQLSKDFEGLELGWPEAGHEALQAQGTQHRLNLGDQEVRKPPGKARGRDAGVLAPRRHLGARQ